MSLMSDSPGSRGGGGFNGMPGMAGGSPNVNAMLALAQGASGNTKYGPASDLVNGLADCSGSVSDLYEVLKTGTSSPARDFTTANFGTPAGAAALGFQPGFMPGAFNVGVTPYGPNAHMAVTLPNGVNFEGGGGTGGGAQYGGSAAGALDPQFQSQYYLPVGGPSAMGPAPLGGGAGPSTPMGWGGPGVPGGITAGGGQGPILGANPLGPGVGASAGGTGVPFPASPGGGGQIGGGMLGAAEDAGTMAMDVMMPGAGTGAKIGIQLAKRAIQFGAQAAGIGVSGLMETFLPAGSPLAANSWFTKLAGGLAGARPAKDNMAGKQTAQAPPVGQGGAGQAGSTDRSVTNNINVKNEKQTEDQTGSAIAQHLTAQYAGPGPG
jgi:hypothetical protein